MDEKYDSTGSKIELINDPEAELEEELLMRRRVELEYVYAEL